MKVVGVAVNDQVDSTGERFDLSGCDFSELEGKPILWEFQVGNTVGIVRKAELIDGRVVVTARIFDDNELKEPIAENKVSYGVSGVCLKREGVVLTKTRLTGLSLTLGGVHPDYKIKVDE